MFSLCPTTVKTLISQPWPAGIIVTFGDPLLGETTSMALGTVLFFINLRRFKVRSFLICPVRNSEPGKTAGIVMQLEADGFDVHWPHRDTDQNDDTGLRICTDNRQAIEGADVVHVVWDGVSQGCLFDLGMAFAMRKPITAISLPAQSRGKSFQNFIRAMEAHHG